MSIYKRKILFDELDSTNTYAKNSCPPDGTLIVADRQTAGRGRRGHDFFSPRGGIYFSYVKHNLNSGEASFLTVRAAVAVALALEKFGMKPQIKWVNDIYINDRKVCGILCEQASLPNKSDFFYIVGIGINLSTEGFPAELLEKAGAIELDDEKKASLTDAVIEAFEDETFYKDTAALVKEYRKRSYLSGKLITFEQNGIKFTGIAEDYNDQCNLIVRLLDEDGQPQNKTMTLSSGEVFTYQ